MEKKIGLFSIGGLRQITIHNLDFSLYLPAATGMDSSPDAGATSHSLLDELKDSIGGLAEAHRGGAGFQADNVLFQVFLREEPLLKIRAGELTVSWREGNFRFSKRVRLEYEGVRSRPGKVVFDPREMLLIPERGRELSLTGFSHRRIPVTN